MTFNIHAGPCLLKFISCRNERIIRSQISSNIELPFDLFPDVLSHYSLNFVKCT